jgi:DNA-binding response OmpR family regulator
MLTILVVDDSKTLRFALSKMIERMGHRAIVASNGEEALELFKRERPGLVMLDVLMPDMDGYSVARAMRSYRIDDWVPIIFLSAKEDDQDLERGIEAGGDDYLVKPVSYVVLNAKIRAMQRIDDMRQRLLQLSNELAQANME